MIANPQIEVLDAKVVEAFDHVAYVVKNTEASMAAFGPLYPRVEVFRRFVASQKAYITYLSAPWGGPKVELVEPENGSHALSRLVKERDCAIYHLCFRVREIHDAYRRLRRRGFVPLTRPFAALEEGELAAHMYHADCGMIEIVGPVRE